MIGGMQFILAVAILGVIIMFHEFGHFLAARAFGVGVTEFSLGMGPVMCWTRWSDTVYSIRWIPIGGFCSMFGEPAPEADKESGRKKNQPDFKTDWKPEQSFLAHPKWQQMLVSLAGPFANVWMAFCAAVILAALPGINAGRGEVTSLGPVTIAQEAGILPGDIIMEVDGRDVIISQEYSSYLVTHPKTKEGYDLTVYRPADGKEYTFHLVPDKETNLVGVTYKSQELTGPLSWLDGGYRLLHNSVRMSFDSLAMLFRGDAKIRDLSGIIGITASVGNTVSEAADVQMAGKEEGSNTAILQAVLSLVMLLCVSLAVINMLPLPALDGGRALMALGEAVTGKRIPVRVTECINGVCMIALFLFMGFVMILDLMKLFSAMV